MPTDLNMKHTEFVSSTGEINITVLIDGELYSARSDHHNWDAIYAGMKIKDPEIKDLFKTADTVAKKFAELTDRISVHAGIIFWDGDPIHNSLTVRILALMDERVEDWRVFVNFMDKLYTNPDPRSQEQAFDYLMKHQFTITPDGNFLGYKGVGAMDGEYYSHQVGDAIVDDVPYTQTQIPNTIGAIVRMPRASVLNDPYTPCHHGLHVATFDFAKSFAGISGAVLEVEVNPRDIVSIPYDSNKMRVCRYKVVRVVEEPSATVYQPVEVMTGAVDMTGAILYGFTPRSWESGEVSNITTDPSTPLTDDITKSWTQIRRVTSDEFTDMQERAKRRRRNFIKYAQKRGKWILEDGKDGSKMSHWKVEK